MGGEESGPGGLPDPLIGTRFGNFTFQERIGAGAMGTVYLGVHPTLFRRVAIKVIHPALVYDGEALSRFIDEARVVSGLRHPGIAQVFDFGTLPDGRPCTVMEFLEGGSDLEQLLAQRPRLGVDEVIELGRQAALALAAAHERGVLHCDVKPANLYLGRDEHGAVVVKVMDFGVARLVGQARALRRPGDEAPETPVGVIMGTPEYLSPEQIRGREQATGLADLYSLGVVLYRAITGRAPFHGAATLFELLDAHLVANPEPIDEKEAPAALGQLVLRCLAKRPEDRFADMRALAAALEEVAGGAGAPSGGPARSEGATLTMPVSAPEIAPGGAGKARPPGSRRLAVWGLAGLLALLGGGLALLGPRRAPEPAKGPAAPVASRSSNPYSVDDAAVVAAGAVIYTSHCARCHGAQGDGAGPDVPAGLEPRSFADARIPAGLLDLYRFEVVRRGIEHGGHLSMPAFASRLGEDDTWRVVTYVATLASGRGARAAVPEAEARPPFDAALRREGAGLFRRKCASCHGKDGRGKGPASRYLVRPVADLTRGVFKLRSSPRGELPTDDDLFGTLTRGMGVSGMPAFARLPARQRWALVAHVRSLSPRFSDGGPAAGEVLAIPPRPRTSAADLDHGAEAYRLAGCPTCHGDLGRGDGPRAAQLVDDQGRKIRPTDLTRRFFIGGTEPAQIYRTVMTGIDGTPMPQGSDFFTPAQGWQVVAYLLSLQGR